jgi:hypothetical protein
MMEITLPQRQVDEIVHKLHILLRRDMKEFSEQQQLPEMVTTAEAAKILGISADRMRKVADRYPHIKKGDNKQGQLLFVRKSLLQ